MNKKLVKQIKEQVKAQVSTVFAEEDLNSQKRVLEELLQNSATDMAELTEQLAAKEVELTEFQSQLDEQAERMKELEDRIDTMKTSTDESAAKVTEITEERDSLKAELHKLNQQIALENRVKELDSAGVLRSGEAADKQRVFIMKLSDEEFADYKEHLVETKAEIEAAVKATADPKPTEPSTTANEPTEPVEPEDTSANTEHANKPNARELAAITSEVRLSDETKSKYASLFSEDE